MNQISHFWNYLGKKSVNRYATAHINVRLGFIQHLYDTTGLNLKLWPAKTRVLAGRPAGRLTGRLVKTSNPVGNRNSEFSKTHCKSVFPELLHPNSCVQSTGIIHKLYETKPNANIW